MSPIIRPSSPVENAFLVVQRANGHWSPDAKIIAVFDSEFIAETFAYERKRLQPQQHFGICKLRSEVREVTNPIEIVRATD